MDHMLFWFLLKISGYLLSLLQSCGEPGQCGYHVMNIQLFNCHDPIEHFNQELILCVSIVVEDGRIIEPRWSLLIIGTKNFFSMVMEYIFPYCFFWILLRSKAPITLLVFLLAISKVPIWFGDQLLVDHVDIQEILHYCCWMFCQYHKIVNMSTDILVHLLVFAKSLV
jgi:hypothetical protein